MAPERISGPQKAAIFLFSIGEELASEIVKNLGEGEIKKLSGSMAKISILSPHAVEAVFAEFHDLASSDRPIPVGQQGSSQFIRKVLSRAVEEPKAQALLQEIQEEERWNLFQKIRRLDPRTLANFIKNEHPQTVSIILAHLDPIQTASVLEELPAALQTEVVCRIAELENVPPGILEEIDQALQEEISTLENVEGRQVGGVRSVAEILNRMDSTLENALLKSIEEQKQGLADEIRQLMFVFEDLLNVEERSMMTLLKEVSQDVLKLALKTASEELKEKFFRNMSERAVQMLKEDLEVMGPVRLKDVEGAQQTILGIAKKLEGEGKIVLANQQKEEVYV